MNVPLNIVCKELFSTHQLSSQLHETKNNIMVLLIYICGNYVSLILLNVRIFMDIDGYIYENILYIDIFITTVFNIPDITI